MASRGVRPCILFLEVQNSGLEEVYGLGKLHRRRKEDMPGEYLERSSSSGNAWPAGQEAGLGIAAAACSVPRQKKHARCRSPVAREPGQEEQDDPAKDPVPVAGPDWPGKGQFLWWLAYAAFTQLNLLFGIHILV